MLVYVHIHNELPEVEKRLMFKCSYLRMLPLGAESFLANSL